MNNISKNNQLYVDIMKSVSTEIKKALGENTDIYFKKEINEGAKSKMKGALLALGLGATAASMQSCVDWRNDPYMNDPRHNQSGYYQQNYNNNNYYQNCQFTKHFYDLIMTNYDWYRVPIGTCFAYKVVGTPYDNRYKCEIHCMRKCSQGDIYHSSEYAIYKFQHTDVVQRIYEGDIIDIRELQIIDDNMTRTNYQ